MTTSDDTNEAVGYQVPAGSTDSMLEHLTQLTEEKANLQQLVARANTRAYQAEKALTDFKTEVVTLADEYLRNNGKCQDVLDALDALGLELPKRIVSFTVVTRVNVTITVPHDFDTDPEDSDFLEGLVSVMYDGSVEVEGGKLEDVTVDGGELDSIEDIHAEN